MKLRLLLYPQPTPLDLNGPTRVLMTDPDALAGRMRQRQQAPWLTSVCAGSLLLEAAALLRCARLARPVAAA